MIEGLMTGELRDRRGSIAPQLRDYGKVNRVFWPLVTATAPADFTSRVVTTDARGHRVTRLGDRTARSDAAPEDAAFLLGGSYSFGVGASSDAGTLAAALWRRTGVPYVNLGIRAGTSVQELISALPFADRRTTFVMCSGLNNFATSTGGRGVDPLFGPMYHESHLRTLAGVQISVLARLVSKPLARFDDRALRRELRRRSRKRISKRLRPLRRLKKRVRGRLALDVREPRPPAARDEEPDYHAMVSAAAERQLRDLRMLRRLVPDECRVIFALQPLALAMQKEWSREEQELFMIGDAVQTQRWQQLKGMLETHWAPYARMLEQGCAEAGVPYLDLSRAAYSGWCFVDRAHMTDRGYDAAAELLEEVLPHADR